MEHFAKRFTDEIHAKQTNGRLCNGPFLSRAQYLPDLEHWGYDDARLAGRTHMTTDDVDLWTSGIEPQNRPN